MGGSPSGGRYAPGCWPALRTAEADAVELEQFLRERGYELPPENVLPAMANRGGPGLRCTQQHFIDVLEWMCTVRTPALFQTDACATL